MRETFLPFSKPSIEEWEISEVAKVLRSGWITTGPKNAEFEKAFCEYTGAKYAIPLTSDEAELKALYTEATEIYLTEVPSFSLMYRPEMFHAVNESVWTNFPAADDGENIPPTCCTDGYGIKALYNLELVEG